MSALLVNRRRRRRCSGVSAASIVCLLILVSKVDSFARFKSGSTTGSFRTRGIRRDAEKSAESSWSNRASGRESPLQVRRRVKAVLEKARTRTGIDNTSVPMVPKPSNVVAEAASLGGLGDGSVDFVLQLKQQQEYNTNGKESSSALKSSSPDVDWVWDEDERSSNGGDKKRPKEFDEISGDVPAATKFPEPLPFKLPKLTEDQLRRIRNGERIQEQSRMGREGSGYVVVDVKAPPYVVWECLLDFESYPELIPTVRDIQLFTSQKLDSGYVNEKPVLPGKGREARHYGTPSITRAAFVLSKFRLNIAAVHKYTPHPDGDYMIFTLDESCTNFVLKGAKGIWYTQANPDGREVSRALHQSDRLS